MADYEAKIADVEKKHYAEFVVVAAKYEEKCKEVHILEAELEKTNKDVGHVVDDNDDGENYVDEVDGRAYARKCIKKMMTSEGRHGYRVAETTACG